MSITFEIPLDLLAQEGVSEAITHLLGVLGSQDAAPDLARIQAARSIARKPQARRRSRPDIKSLPEGERWAKYFETLPEPSQRFLRLLESRGQLSVSEAVEALGFDGPKAMGGLTGAMTRWAPKQGVSLPFKAMQDAHGQRCWVWTGAAEARAS